MKSEKDLIVNFISWIWDTHEISLEEWYGPECEIVTKEDLAKYVEDYLETTYER